MVSGYKAFSCDDLSGATHMGILEIPVEKRAFLEVTKLNFFSQKVQNWRGKSVQKRNMWVLEGLSTSKM